MNIIWISFYDATNGLPAKDFTSLTNLNKRFIRLNKQRRITYTSYMPTSCSVR